MTETNDQAVVASYRNHEDAEEAVRKLTDGGVPVKHVSIIGRHWQVREDMQGYYRPADAAIEGAGTGAWVGGLFGLLMGFGFFLVPVVGPVLVLGPLAGMVAGAIGGAGVGALINGLMALGIPEEHALKYRARLEAGEFLVVVHGPEAEVARAREILQATPQTDLQTHAAAAGEPV